MYNTIYMDERVSLTPSEMNLLTSVDSISELLEQKLREIHEEKCNANGYVRPDSIRLLGRSMGVAENGRFTGNFVYDSKFKCDVLFPTVGLEMVANIIKVNEMGAYAVYEEAIRVLLPRDFHLGNEAFDALKEGDKVKVVLDRSRFQTKDPFIMAVGHLVQDEDVPVKPESDILLMEALRNAADEPTESE